MKFKVGDKVHIRKDLEVGKMYGGLNIHEKKAEFLGKTTTVTAAWGLEYSLDIDAGKWSWTDEMLEAVNEEAEEIGKPATVLAKVVKHWDASGVKPEPEETPYGFRIEGGGISKEGIRAVLKDHATRTFHDPETDVIEMLIPVPLATDIICQYIGIGAKGTVSEPEDSKVTRHKQITEELTAIYEAKNHDYGDSFQETYRKLGLISAVTRITDKVNRLQSLSTKEQRVAEESIKDTLIDCANYCIMTLIALEEE